MTELLGDVEGEEFPDCFSPEEIVEKVKTDDFLRGCVGVTLANEVRGDHPDAVDADTG
jgi:hypothetical protein